MDEEKSIKEAVRILAHNANVMGLGRSEIDSFVGALTEEHRTLQQAIWKIIFGAIMKYGALGNEYFDARNEASRGLCQRVSALIKSIGGVYLPLI